MAHREDEALGRLYAKSDAPTSLPGGPDRSGDGRRFYRATASRPRLRALIRLGALALLLAFVAAFVAAAVD
jgi:hypothetical protein